MGLRNLPTDQAVQLRDLITCKPHQISSMGLTTFGSPIDITLLAFAEGEDVSEEAYGGDTLYYLVEGTATIQLPDREVAMQTGDVYMVPAHVLNAVHSKGDFKMLQISLS